MPRFLTPARICLLVLIRHYQEGQQSSESSLPLLDFLARHITSSLDNDIETINDRNALSSSDIGVLAEKLQRWSSKYVGRSMYDILLWSIWEYTGLDSLNTLISEINSTGYRGPEAHPGVHKNAFTPASPFGQYIRRCWVEFTRLQFDDTIALWNAFAAYRAPTYDDWASKNPETAAEQQENASWTSVPPVPKVQSAISKPESSFSASVVDADILLHFAIYRLQKVGTRVPGEIKSKLETWIGDQWDSSTQSLHFFMAFFEHWRAGQYTMALESLHRYFDYSLAARSGNDNMRIYYQYALLHLSVLHADFECWDESIDAMNECIATARENQDTACLNFALSWLLYLRHAHPSKTDSSRASFETISGVVGSGSGESDEIAFLKQKAKEGKHWMLLSSTLLEEAKLEIYGGGSPNRAQEHVVQSMFLNVQHDLRTLAPAASIFQGACLDRLGQGHLARRTYELANAVHPAHCPLNDKVRSACRLAHTFAQAGQYNDAMKILDELTPSLCGVLKLEQRAKAFKLILQLKRHLQNNSLETATHHLSHLRPFRSDPEILFEIHLLEIDLLIKQNLFDKALAKASTHLRATKGKGTDVAHRLTLLLVKARIFAAGGQAVKGFTLALRATAMAERHLLVPIQIEGVAGVGRILVELGEYEAARVLTEAILPHALETHNTPLTARLFILLAESNVGFADTTSPQQQQTRVMRSAVGFIERGRLAYERVGDVDGQLECLVMKSKIANWSGDETSARVADEMYLGLWTARYSETGR